MGQLIRSTLLHYKLPPYTMFSKVLAMALAVTSAVALPIAEGDDTVQRGCGEVNIFLTYFFYPSVVITANCAVAFHPSTRV